MSGAKHSVIVSLVVARHWTLDTRYFLLFYTISNVLQSYVFN